MSQETLTWLNSMILAGRTDKYGLPWWYNEDSQTEESNVYPAFIPIEDVRRRLFNWKVVEGDFQSTGHIITDDGGEEVTITDPTRKNMLRPPRALGPNDPGAVLGSFRSGYVGHDFEDTLLTKVSDILDDDLGITSAGLLKQGAVGFVSAEVSEEYKPPEDVEFRPLLGAVTSFDGSYASTFWRSIMLPICDNTLAASLDSKGETFYKVKHSKYSQMKLNDAKVALGIIQETADDFAKEVAELTSIKVSEGDWARFQDTLTPLVHDKGEDKECGSYTMELSTGAAVQHLWTDDKRVAPWRGTAFGVLQAVNTYEHHYSRILKGERAERNAENAISGKFADLDVATLTMLQ